MISDEDQCSWKSQKWISAAFCPSIKWLEGVILNANQTPLLSDIVAPFISDDLMNVDLSLIRVEVAYERKNWIQNCIKIFRVWCFNRISSTLVFRMFKLKVQALLSKVSNRAAYQALMQRRERAPSRPAFSYLQDRRKPITTRARPPWCIHQCNSTKRKTFRRCCKGWRIAINRS